jgi:hypothetical protein
VKKLILGLLLGAFFYGPAEASWIKEPRLLTYEASSQKAKPSVHLFCGLTQGNWCALNQLAAKLRAKGYKATVYSHWVNPASVMKAGDILIGHSKGADNVVATPKAKRAFSIDATVANRGAASPTVNYYNPANRIPFVICCGGASVRGAKNVIWRMPHVAMAADQKLHSEIIRQIERLK